MRIFTTYLLLLFSTFSFAQDLDSDPIIGTETSQKWEMSGFVDGYYQYNFNEAALPTSFTEQHNQFTLGMANLVVSKEGKVGFVADIAFGPRAEVANGSFEGAPTLTAIKQLYVTYSPSDAITLTFGNFGTFIGYELIDSPGNVNYSTSYLFSNGPFYHTGLKADFSFGDNFGAMVGIFNDTDNKFDEVPGKHVGAQLWTEQGGLSAYLNVLYGKEEADPETNGFQVDLTATYEVSDKLSLGLNVSDKTSSTETATVGGFTGAAVYATISTSDVFALGLRGEYFNFKDGDDALDNDSVFAATVSGNITLAKRLRLIPELRFDSSSNDEFFPSFENGDLSELKSGMGTFILAAVYDF